MIINDDTIIKLTRTSGARIKMIKDIFVNTCWIDYMIGLALFNLKRQYYIKINPNYNDISTDKIWIGLKYIRDNRVAFMKILSFLIWPWRPISSSYELFYWFLIEENQV